MKSPMTISPKVPLPGWTPGLDGIPPAMEAEWPPHFYLGASSLTLQFHGWAIVLQVDGHWFPTDTRGG